MIAPTLFYLKLTLNKSVDAYEAWEQHHGQEVGCFMTQPEFITVVERNDLDKFISDYADTCARYGDKLENVEVKV